MKKRQAHHHAHRLDETKVYLSDLQAAKRIKEHLQWVEEGGATRHEVDTENSPIGRWVRARGNGYRHKYRGKFP